MSKIFKVGIASLAFVGVTVFAGCSLEKVGPTEKGKFLSYSGYSDEIVGTGRYFLWTIAGQRLIKLDTAVNVADEEISQVAMKDGLMMDFSVQFRTRLNSDPKIINSILNEVRPDINDEISWEEVYRIYGKKTVQQVSRAVLSRYTVNDILTNYENVSVELFTAISKEFKERQSPLIVSEVNLGRPRPPKSIMDAMEVAARKVAELKQIEADREKDIASAQANEAIARENAKSKIIEAQTQAEQQRIMSQGLTPEYLEFLRIEAMSKSAEKGNATYIPYQALGNDGLSVKMFNK